MQKRFFNSRLVAYIPRRTFAAIWRAVLFACNGLTVNLRSRPFIACIPLILFALIIVLQLINISALQRKHWLGKSDSMSIRYVNVGASRGNILASDNNILATSGTQYELYFDTFAGGITADSVFFSKVDSLSGCLASLYPDHNVKEYSHLLIQARKDSNHYMLLRRQVTYPELDQIRRFPMLNVQKYGGGLIVNAQNKRILPYNRLALRTIGYKKENVNNPVGLEGAYANYINGENGKRLMQRSRGGTWVPVNGEEEISVNNGADIVTTLDINYQDVAEKALKRQLEATAANHGCLALMETQTGKIKAITNFTRSNTGQYNEVFNYAIGANTEPGSLFQLASYMVMLDGFKIDTSTIVTVSRGGFQILDPVTGRIALVVRNATGPRTMKVSQAFSESADATIAKLVYSTYKDYPKTFTDKLYSYYLQEKNGLQLHGEGAPIIKNPASKTWNPVTSLPRMAFGYDVELTPLQLLAFYNAVANHGKFIAPLFVENIQRGGRSIENPRARTISDKLCSDKTLAKLDRMLKDVVNEGTGHPLKNSTYGIAGKTGIAMVANGALGYGDQKNLTYSFCGYFPADHPKYSMIVVISNPVKGSKLPAYVAGPVFRQVSDRVYADIRGEPAKP